MFAQILSGGVFTFIEEGLKGIAKNFWVMWFLTLAILIGDTAIADFLDFPGIVGVVVTTLVNFVLGFFGISILITSFQVMVLLAISPLVLYAVNKS